MRQYPFFLFLALSAAVGFCDDQVEDSVVIKRPTAAFKHCILGVPHFVALKEVDEVEDRPELRLQGGIGRFGHSSSIYPNLLDAHFTFYHFNIKKGEKLRIVGGVYEVKSISRTNGAELAELQRDATWDVSEKGIYFIPLHLNSVGCLLEYRIDFFASSYKPSQPPDPYAVVDPTDFKKFSTATELQSRRPNPIVIKAGETLWLRDQGHIVRRIVLSDEKQKLRGWMEFDQEPSSKLVDGKPVTIEKAK